MSVHVLIRRLRGEGDGRAIVFNQSEEWVVERIVGPWNRGEDLVVNGEHWNPRDVQITIRETPNHINGSDSLTAWTNMREIADDRTDHFLARPAGNAAPHEAVQLADDRRKVMVVLGRDSRIGKALFSFLRSIDLRPLEWTQLVGSASSGAPYIGQVLDAAFAQCQAVVVLMTPDDLAYLRQDLVPEGDPDSEAIPQGQPRPNVFYEAGMAMGRFPRRTIFVEVGMMRAASDLSGLHAVRLNEGPECRRDLAKRLEGAGCEVNVDGTDWLSVGDFTPPLLSSDERPLESAPEKAALIGRIDAFIGDIANEEFAPISHARVFNDLLDEAGVDSLPRANTPINARRSSMKTGEMRMLLNQVRQVLQQQT